MQYPVPNWVLFDHEQCDLSSKMVELCQNPPGKVFSSTRFSRQWYSVWYSILLKNWSNIYCLDFLWWYYKHLFIVKFTINDVIGSQLGPVSYRQFLGSFCAAVSNDANSLLTILALFYSTVRYIHALQSWIAPCLERNGSGLTMLTIRQGKHHPKNGLNQSLLCKEAYMFSNEGWFTSSKR